MGPGAATNGDTINDRDEMKTQLRNFFKDVFNDPRSLSEELPRWIFQSWHSSIFDYAPNIDAYLIRRAILKLRKGATFADDNIVGEM